MPMGRESKYVLFKTDTHSINAEDWIWNIQLFGYKI